MAKPKWKDLGWAARKTEQPLHEGDATMPKKDPASVDPKLIPWSAKIEPMDEEIRRDDPRVGGAEHQVLFVCARCGEGVEPHVQVIPRKSAPQSMGIGDIVFRLRCKRDGV